MVTQSTFSLSGLKLAKTRNTVSAHNVSNKATDTFARQSARAVTTSGPGVRSAVDALELSPEEHRIARVVPGAQNNVNLIQETVNRIAAQRSFQANVRVVNAQDRFTQSLLDVTA